VLRAINATAQVVSTALIGVAAVSIIVRLRRARGVERQQLKWLAYAAVVLAGYYLLTYLYTRGTIRSIPPLVDTAVSGLSLVVVPAAIGVAVLRYRLYDIDRIINRTLVYGLLTAILGTVYAGVVLVLGSCRAVSAPRRAGRWPAPPWPRPSCSNRPAAASNGRLTAASTGAGTTRPRPSRRSPPACATRSTWAPSPPR
jgi:hypothetical protein